MERNSQPIVGKDSPDQIRVQGFVTPAVAINQETGEQVGGLLVDMRLTQESTVNASSKTSVDSWVSRIPGCIRQDIR